MIERRRAFYALSLLAAEPHHEAHLPTGKKRAVLEKLLRKAQSSGCSYLIHTYDKQTAAQGLSAAAAMPRLLRSPHALHMPSHILHGWVYGRTIIDSNRASMLLPERLPPCTWEAQGHQYHAMEFLVYAYLQSGREPKADVSIRKSKLCLGEEYGFDPALPTPWRDFLPFTL